MKKVLITGLNSYVGNKFDEYCQNDFEIDKISLRDNAWQSVDFSVYDSILHVAGIAHTSKDPKLKNLYYEINTDLTSELAKKAKEAGVSQFVFMSSIIVYGDSAPIGQQKIIDKNTTPRPDDFYGDSKLQAEKKLELLKSDTFNISIVRPPMVYGEASKGNYPKLKKLAGYALIFPDIENERSVLHIDKLSQELKLIIKDNLGGVFMPQDDKYLCTSKFIKEYRSSIGKRTFLVKIFNPLVKMISYRATSLQKMFGNLIYKK